MTALRRRIEALIAATGPIGVSDYMAMCLFDPDHGYYTTREPFGVEGDFTTAPEISQMFGELAAVWLYSAWNAIGRPAEIAVAEIGPGRGTLMRDMIRTFARLDAAFATAARFALVEASPRLIDVQKSTLRGLAAALEWHGDVGALPERPTLFVGNEIFDAIPVRQFEKHGGLWRERCIGLDADGALSFVLGASAPDPGRLPPDAANAPDGSIWEIAPRREALMDAVAERIARFGGGALIFDYGHLQPGLGDTLQAVRTHAPVDVFDRPGQSDLTSHVDFSALADVARAHGLAASGMSQGAFLLSMGLVERAGRLGAERDAAARERISGEVERLAGPGGMGDLFKALAVLPRGTAVHPFGGAH